MCPEEEGKREERGVDEDAVLGDPVARGGTYGLSSCIYSINARVSSARTFHIQQRRFPVHCGIGSVNR